MKSRPFVIWSVLLLAVLSLIWLPGGYAAAADDDTTTEDVIYLNDGRVLHGQIISETADEIVFEALISSIKATLTLSKEDIFQIKRDVPVEGGQKATKDAKEETKATADSRDRDRSDVRTRHRAQSDDENATGFYLIPMKGQMGTDVNHQFYKGLADDIRAHDPDYIIIEMDCKDIGSAPTDLIFEFDPDETGLYLVDEYRDMINFFRDELREYRQVIWIHDSVGYSSMVALAWPDMYMKPDGRLAGLSSIGAGFASWGDEDIRGKMREATMAMLKGFLEYGTYSLFIVDAMVRPEFPLSATWKGREVEWTLDRNGEYVVDGSEQTTVDFTAKTAEDFCISDGTAETLDDLALLMGIREYRVLDGEAESEFEKYTKDWRRTYENALQYLQDYQKYMSWAGGDETIQWLGRAKSMLEKVVAAIDRYDAVEIRLQRHGVSRFSLVTTIEQLKERLRALRQGGRGGGGGGRGGGGSGMGAGG
ncbi:MAG: hypothetical protein JSV91_16050 [Phycisphaerales bacterium]|nr:MAG: hypothetical protein JSV91_16050 [Phycisphaerales bacterium]